MVTGGRRWSSCRRRGRSSAPVAPPGRVGGAGRAGAAGVGPELEPEPAERRARGRARRRRVGRRGCEECEPELPPPRTRFVAAGRGRGRPRSAGSAPSAAGAPRRRRRWRLVRPRSARRSAAPPLAVALPASRLGGRRWRRRRCWRGAAGAGRPWPGTTAALLVAGSKVPAIGQVVEHLGGHEHDEGRDRDADHGHAGEGADEIGVCLADHCYLKLVWCLTNYR